MLKPKQEFISAKTGLLKLVGLISAPPISILKGANQGWIAF